MGMTIRAVVALLILGTYNAEGAGLSKLILKSTETATIALEKGSMLILTFPPEAQIAEYVVGDDTQVSVEMSSNIFRLLAKAPGAKTTLNLITPDNRVFTLVLKEGIPKGDSPQYQIAASFEGESAATDAEGRKRFIPLSEHDAAVQPLRDEVASMRQAVADAEATVDERIATYKIDHARAHRAYYTEPLNKAPFYVTGVWHDGESTWIQFKWGGDASNMVPSVYEVFEKKGSMLNVVPHPGPVYLLQIPKVVKDGYLQIGSESKWRFSLAK